MKMSIFIGLFILSGLLLAVSSIDKQLIYKYKLSSGCQDLHKQSNSTEKVLPIEMEIIEHPGDVEVTNLDFNNFSVIFYDHGKNILANCSVSIEKNQIHSHLVYKSSHKDSEILFKEFELSFYDRFSYFVLGNNNSHFFKKQP